MNHLVMKLPESSYKYSPRLSGLSSPLLKVLVTQSCLALCNLIECNPPVSPVHEILQAKNTEVDNHSLLQGIFPVQGSNPSFLNWWQILYHLNYQGSPLLK